MVAKDPVAVTVTDVLEFISEQRRPRRGGHVVRLDDGEAGLSARTVRRRLSSLPGFFGYLSARGLVGASPVPSGPLSRSPKDRGRAGGRR